MRRAVVGVGMVASLGAHAVPADAQSTASFGVGAGVAVPVGALRHEVNPGWRAIGTLDLVVPDLPATLRFDAAYDRFGAKAASSDGFWPATGARTIASGTFGLAIGPTSPQAVSPYAIGGVGINRMACGGGVTCDDTRQMGWIAGLGARFDLFRVSGFAEARLHCVVQDRRDDCLLPITVGVFFGGAHRDERERPSPGHSPD